MCGIFGWIPAGNTVDAEVRSVALRLSSILRHRGPNDAGYAAFNRSGQCFTERDAAVPEQTSILLGQTRLSIIDLSAAGHQPMTTADGRYTIVFNGEIYNYVELRSELEREGVAFSTRTDTEVLLQWVIRHGASGLSRLTGMFAFALFDRQERTLFCVRDFFGIKPFYYTRSENGFCFASELPALLEFPGVSRAVDPQSAYSFLCFGQYDIGDATFLRDVRQLPAGHCLTVRLDDSTPEQLICYWRPELSRRSMLGFQEAASEVRRIFLDNIRLHLRSDVPLGVALSGGIDSSAVTCAVRHLEPDAELHTFSFVASDCEISEESWIDKVAAHARVIPHKVILGPADLARDLDVMIRNLGEPFGSTSIYAQRRVFQLARECGVVVTLDGQGADELFGGYHGYPGARLASLLLHGDLPGMYRFFKATTSWPGRTRSYVLQRFARELTPECLLELGLKICGRTPTPQWLDMERIRGAGVRCATLHNAGQMYPVADRLRRTLAYQLTWNGLPQLLRHGDRNSMAFSIESRVPFLTREMAEFALSLPEEYLVDQNGCTKAVFRAAMRGIVPHEVLDRRDKIGFATPEKQWLFSLADWVEGILQDANEIPYVRLDHLRAEWKRIRAGEKPFDWQVWRWINYIRWCEIFI